MYTTDEDRRRDAEDWSLVLGLLKASSAQQYADSVRDAITNGASMMDLDAIVAREDLAEIGRRGYVRGTRVA